MLLIHWFLLSWAQIRPRVVLVQTNWRNIFSVLQSTRQTIASYQPGTTVLAYEEELSVSPDQPATLQDLLRRGYSDTEGSSNSEGSHATGDSGHYSHDETELTNLSSDASSRPPSLSVEHSGDSNCCGPEEPNKLSEEGQAGLKLARSVENGCWSSELFSVWTFPLSMWACLWACVREFVCVDVSAVSVRRQWYTCDKSNSVQR